MANKTSVDHSIENIKKSMKFNRLSSFYLFANDYHFDVIDKAFEEMKPLLPKRALKGFDHIKPSDFLGNQRSFAISQIKKDDGEMQGTETCYLRGIECVGDELVFCVELLVEDPNGGKGRLKYSAGQTIDDLMEMSPDEGGTINLESTLKGIANHYINNPFLVAANRVVNFDPEMI